MRSRYLDTIWSIMLEEGGVVAVDDAAQRVAEHVKLGPAVLDGLIGPYRDELVFDHHATETACNDLHADGIDWDATGDPAERVGRGWGGTYGDDFPVPYLAGVLVTVSGSRWLWGAHADQLAGGDGRFTDIVRALASHHGSISDALDTLSARLSVPGTGPGALEMFTGSNQHTWRR